VRHEGIYVKKLRRFCDFFILRCVLYIKAAASCCSNGLEKVLSLVSWQAQAGSLSYLAVYCSTNYRTNIGSDSGKIQSTAAEIAFYVRFGAIVARLNNT
jgi:hypothetical protein